MDITLPVIILVARIVETRMETIRTVYISKGHTYLASGVGVVKVGIWLISTGLVLTNLQKIPAILAYIAGYGIGTLMGMEIEPRIGIGTVIVRIFSPHEPDALMERLWGLGFGITRMNGSGRFTPTVAVLLLVVSRKEISRLLDILKSEYPGLLFTIEDVLTMGERDIYFGGTNGRSILRFFGC